MNYCEKCMRPLDAGGICPVCGVLNPAPLYHLKPGTVLRKKYWIGRAVAEDAQVITYLGRDLTQDSVIILYEFFPAGQVVRSHLGSNTVEEAHFQEKAMERFLTKADILSKFADDPHMMKVTDFFRDNNTAYVVTERIDGVSVQTYLQKKGAIPAKSLLELMEPMLQALSKLHAEGVLHGRISPENIRLYPDGNIKLVNFALGQPAASAAPNHGYAPTEQYKGEACGPWSDIYSLCAVLYYSITGICPQPAAEREKSDLLLRPSLLGVEIEERCETALMLGLEVKADNRLQSVDVMMRIMGFAAEEPESVVIVNEPKRIELSGMPVLEGVDETAERPVDPVEHHGRPSQNLSVYVEPKAELKEEAPVTDKTMINIPGMPKFELSKGKEPGRRKIELTKGKEPVLPAVEEELEATRGVEPDLFELTEFGPTDLEETLPLAQEPPMVISQPQIPASEPVPDFGFSMLADERTVMAPEGYEPPVSVQNGERQWNVPKKNKNNKKKLWIATAAGAVALLAAVFACLYFFTDLFGTKGKEEKAEFTLEGETYTLPAKLDTFLDNGWEVETIKDWETGVEYGEDGKPYISHWDTAIEYDLEDTLEPETAAMVLLNYDSQSVMVIVMNTDDEGKTPSECEVIYVNADQNYQGLAFYGVTTASTREEAEKALGGEGEEYLEGEIGGIRYCFSREDGENEYCTLELYSEEFLKIKEKK